MAYKLSDTLTLERDVTRVKSVLLQNLKTGQSYSAGELLELLEKYGLKFDTNRLQAIREQLTNDDFLVIK